MQEKQRSFLKLQTFFVKDGMECVVGVCLQWKIRYIIQFTEGYFIHHKNKVRHVISKLDLVLFVSSFLQTNFAVPGQQRYSLYLDTSQRGKSHTRCLNMHSPTGCICSQFTGPRKMMSARGGSHSIIGHDAAHCHLPGRPWQRGGKVTQSCREASQWCWVDRKFRQNLRGKVWQQQGQFKM